MTINRLSKQQFQQQELIQNRRKDAAIASDRKKSEHIEPSWVNGRVPERRP